MRLRYKPLRIFYSQCWICKTSAGSDDVPPARKKISVSRVNIKTHLRAPLLSPIKFERIGKENFSSHEKINFKFSWPSREREREKNLWNILYTFQTIYLAWNRPKRAKNEREKPSFFIRDRRCDVNGVNSFQPCDSSLVYRRIKPRASKVATRTSRCM